MTTGTVYAGFNLLRTGAMSALYTDPSVTDATLTISALTYAHVTLESVMGTGKYTSFATALGVAANVTDPLTDFTAIFSATTRLYSITNAGAQAKLDFTSASNGAAGPRLAKALGLTAANAKATSGTGYDCVIDAANGEITSDVLPYYLVPLGRDALSGDGGPHSFNPGGQVRTGVTTNGNALAVRPLTLEKRLKTRAAFNAVANVFARNAEDAEPWTLEDLVEHASAIEPIYLKTSNEGFVGKLTGMACEWTEQTRMRSIRTYEGLWHWDVEMRVLGEI